MASIGFLVVIPLIVLFAVFCAVAYWCFGIASIDSEVFGADFLVIASQPPVSERRLWGMLAMLPALLFWLYSMWRLFLMFLNFNSDSPVGLITIGHLRSFSLFSLLTVIAAFLLSGVMRWAAGVFDDAPLWTHLWFSPAHLVLLFCSAVIYIASHIIEAGYAYKRETEEYV